MDTHLMSLAIAHLKSQRIVFEEGLFDAEIAKIEGTFGFLFPTDLRQFLQTALPVSGGFPNWRSESENRLRWDFFNRPWDGIAFDIEHNDFWFDAWGPKPALFENAVAEAKLHFARVPLLIPVRSHHYLAAAPASESSPVFSVRQTDVSLVGANLLDYLQDRPPAASISTASIPFWSALARSSHVTVPNLAASHAGLLEEYAELVQVAKTAGYWAEIIPLQEGTGVSFGHCPPEEDGRRSGMFWGSKQAFGWLVCIASPRLYFAPQARRVAELCLTLLSRLPDTQNRRSFWDFQLDEGIRREFGLVALRSRSDFDDRREVQLRSLEPLGWREMSDGQQDVVWQRYENVFGYPVSRTGFRTPEPSFTWDISSIYLRDDEYRNELEADLTLKSLAALQTCIRVGEELFVLDWNHACYFFDPHGGICGAGTDSWAVPVLPDGDHYTFLAQDFRFGMVGNCVDQTICVFGRELLDAFAARPPQIFRRPGWTSEERSALQEKWEAQGWSRLSVDDKDALWDQFVKRFDFCVRRGAAGPPGFAEPNPSKTWDMSEGFTVSDQACAEIEADLARIVVEALCQACGAEERLFSLDAVRWYEHYSFSPCGLRYAGRDSWPLAVFPRDNYTIVLTADLRLGVFGNPVERTFCVFGRELLAVLESEMSLQFGPPLRINGQQNASS